MTAATSKTPANVSTVEVSVLPVNGGPAHFHTLLAMTVVALSGVTAAMFRRTHISVEGLPIFGVFFYFALICTVAMYCHWSGYAKLREGCLLVGWAFLLTAILPIPSYFVARDAMPLQDATLGRVDRMLGVDVGAMVAWSRSRPSLNLLLIQCYGLLFPLVGLAAVVPALSGRILRARIFILSTIGGVVAANICLALFPAVGPWRVYHFEPYWNQALYARQLHALRMPGNFVMNPNYDAGLITFPSFHVALSIMGTRALWWLRWMRPFVALACVLIAVSTMATGWHYASDVAGGIVLALACGWLAERCLAPVRAED